MAAPAGAASIYAGIPASLSKTPWIASLTHRGTSLQSLASVPNLNLLEHPPASIGGHILPDYTGEPAPLGITDFGLGSTTYSYNTSHFLGQVVFNSPPNATQPGGTSLIEGSLGGQHEGALGNDYEFGIQLNTVATNISIPGTDQGFMWTQNVVNYNDTGIHFVDDTFNSTDGSGFYMAPGTIYSSDCAGGGPGVATVLQVYGGVYQCVGGTVPLSPASYPVTVQLYNNATVNAQGRDQVSYGYRITEAGTGQVFTGVSDVVVFNNPAAPTPPTTVPGFSVDGFSPNDYQFRDAEIDLVGGIGGDNAVFHSLNGTLNLEYSNASSGAWQNVPSAYNFGSDTGETSAGIADYWVAGTHTLEVNQGPTMLYGLWNAEPQVSVKSGDIQLEGAIDPSYGFVFVSNVNPTAAGNYYGENMSWLPTTPTGTFNTYLPPVGAPWTPDYYVQAFAATAEINGTAVTASTTTYSLSLSPVTPSVSHPLRAPLYMYSDAQASALAALMPGGTSAAPYLFTSVPNVDSNFTFNHLNDYGYPDFEVFQAQDVGNSIHISDLYEGQDSKNGNYYVWDYGGAPTGTLTPIPELYAGGTSILGYTSAIDIFNGVADQVEDQILEETSYGQGWQLVLWEDTNAYVDDILSLENNQGVFVGNSQGTSVDDVGAEDAIGVTDTGSSDTTVWAVSVDDGLGVEADGSSGGTYSYINVTDGGTGVEAGADYGPEVAYQFYYDYVGTTDLTVNDLNVTDSTGLQTVGANISFSVGTTFNNVTLYDPAAEATEGVFLDGVVGTTFNTFTANYALGTILWNATTTTFNDLTLENFTAFYGSVWDLSTGTTVTGMTIFDEEVGLVSGLDGGMLMDTSFTNVWMSDIDAVGIGLDGATTTSFTNLNTSNLGEAGVSMEDSTGLTLTNVLAWGAPAVVAESTDPVTATGITSTNFGEFGVLLVDGATATVTNVVANEESDGLVLDEFTGATVTTVSAADSSVGVLVEESSHDTVTGVTASGGSIGVGVDDSMWITVTTVSATDPAIEESVGVSLDESYYVTVSGVTASDLSTGVFVDESDWTSVTTATVTNMSVAVYSYESEYTSVSGVTATNATLSTPWSDGYPDVGGEELIGVGAVVTWDDEYDSIANVAATTYPAAYFDEDSYVEGVSNVNGTGGTYAIYLDETDASVFSNIGAYQDDVGLYADDSSGDAITMSSFVDCTSYGVALYGGDDTYVYDNNFLGNNGATGTYSAAHIQAYNGFGSDNYYYFEGVGNYWADWHTYNSYGDLAPYPLGDESWDFYPLGGPEGTVAVYVYEEGLATGASWSATVNGATQSTTNDWLAFYVLPGTYAFSAGAVTGYTVTPGTGSLTASGGSVDVDLTFTPQYTVTVWASGVPAGSSWTAIVGGVEESGTAGWLNFSVAPGTYAYQIAPIAGYSASPSSGSLTVVAANYSLAVTFTPFTYAVTVSEGGLASGTSWSATVNGVTQSTAGASMTWYLPNGTYAYSITAPSGYTLSGGSGNVQVNGAPASVAGGFSSTSSTSFVASSTFNTWLAVAIIVAVIALVVALLAVMLRRKNGGPPPATPWTGPASSSSTSGSTASSSGPSWQEQSTDSSSPPPTE
jgi:hypothetical protein